MNELELAKAKGVYSPYAKAFMPYSVQEVGGQKVIHTDYAKAAQMIAQDSALTTAPNVGVPSAFVTLIDPEIMPILFAVQNATRLAKEERRGDWATQSMIFAQSEVTGEVTPYDDYTENVTTDVNYEFPERQNFIFQTAIRYGDREADIAAKAKIALAGDKQRAAAFTISNAHNKFYLYGVAGKRNYGLLNDPNLNSTVTPNSVTVGSDSVTTWSDKMSKDGANFVQDVYNDINKLWSELTKHNGGNIDANSRIILAISNTRSPMLNVPNQFGLTVRAMLKSNFPNMEIVELPQLTTTAGEMLYMMLPNVMGFETAINAYSEKMRLSRIEAHATYFSQKAIGGTFGAVIKRPSAIATMTGI